MIADSVIIDLAGYDGAFLKECEKIFQINAWLDGSEGRQLREWLATAVSEIIELYTTSPGVLMGTLNMGPDLRSYNGLMPRSAIEERDPRYSQSQIDDFEIAYKALAFNMADHLTRMTRIYVDRGIDMGYSDVSFTVRRYRLGCVVLSIRGIEPYPDSPYPNSVRTAPL